MMINTIFQVLLCTKNKTILEFHRHNDLGMATANTISAISSGAGAVSVTVNGLGERAGNACLEEVAAALPMALGLSSHINFRQVFTGFVSTGGNDLRTADTQRQTNYRIGCVYP